MPGREGGDGAAEVLLLGVVRELQALLRPVGPQVPGDSFVMDKFVSKDTLSKVDKAVKDAPWWVSKIFFKKNIQVGFVMRISTLKP